MIGRDVFLPIRHGLIEVRCKAITGAVDGIRPVCMRLWLHPDTNDRANLTHPPTWDWLTTALCTQRNTFLAVISLSIRGYVIQDVFDTCK